nr:hypothetical protein [Tanacetum cinerariifolium]GEZ60177.1 hypothetical protein [Tanacetum cinerariifolium]GFA80359.1 hypothetical protein [Tanacetum cinerariifolium]
NNQKEVDDIKEELKKRNKNDTNSLTQTQDPLAFIASSPSPSLVRQGGVRMERVDTCKEVAITDARCYNYKKQGHYSRNCPSGKVRDKAYYMAKIKIGNMEAFKAEHAGVTEASKEDCQLDEEFLNKVHDETECDQDRLIHATTLIF